MIKVAFIPKEGHREIWEIVIDGEKWREVHRTIFGAKPLFPTLTDNTNLQSLFDSYEYKRVKSYLIWRLSKQSYHSEQLAKLLRERKVQANTIAQALSDFRDSGLLDDENWLQAYMRSQQKKYSLPLILQKLRKKGLSSETIDKLSKEWKNPEEEGQAILHLLQTRYRNKDFTDFKDKQKVIASLLRKGFSYDLVKEAFKQHCSGQIIER